MAALGGGGGSLVADVLQNCGGLEKKDLQTCVGKLSQKAVEVKAQVYESIYKQYTEFIHSYNLTMELNSKVKELSSDMNNLNSKIQGDVETKLQKANSIYTDLSQQMSETNAIIKVLQKLCEIHDALTGLSVLKDCKEYEKASQSLNLVKNHLGDLPKSGDESKIFKAIRAQYRKQYSDLIYMLESSWEKCLCWQTSTTSSWDNMDGHLKTELKISTAETADIDLVLQTMESLKILDGKLQDFGKRFLQFIIRPVVIFLRLKPSHKETKENITLTFSKEVCKVEDQGNSIFEKLTRIFELLSKSFLNKKVFILTENEEKKETSLLHLLGKFLWPSLSDIIINDCLSKFIPKTSGQLEKYEGMVDAAVKFEGLLMRSGYLKEGTDTLQVYTKNITTHFSNKKCQDLLFTAREMLKTTINFRDTHLVSEGAKNLTPEFTFNSKKSNEEKVKKEPIKISSIINESDENKAIDNTFIFPTCRVSKCIPTFIALVYKSLVEATETSKPGDVRLFYTVRQMFDMYRFVVPTYYEDDLRDLPQLSALHYNNCMYLSHHLLTLGHQFRPKLPPPLNSGAATFVDLVSPTRQLGEKCFEDQLRKQSKILLEIIDGGGSFHDLDKHSMSNAIEQVCYQLRKLKKVWQDILPLNIYQSSLGALVNVVMKTIIDEILKLEDISSEDSRSLDDLTAILENKVPEVFEVSVEDVAKVVTVWKKYLELRCVINGSLQVIEDRWREGKGPLAQEFSCNEIRGLIRALFQNTDQRANLLGKIRPTTQN